MMDREGKFIQQVFRFIGGDIVISVVQLTQLFSEICGSQNENFWIDLLQDKAHAQAK